ncbi:MAG: hypothetical protein K8U57_13290 [Planctomycetes bacterium]|nr:hypothetical protein [Planctomycetota bacterium]
MTRVLAVVPFALVALLASGCGAGAGVVSGGVTYEGQPVKKGYVTFTPADGKGPMVGGPITDGRYTLENVLPGPKVVKVEASSGAGPSLQTTEDVAKLSKEWRDKMGPDGVIRTETVPADAEGNNQNFEVKIGAQTLDLTLKKPAAKK